MSQNSIFMSWSDVESAIRSEVLWLRSVVKTYHVNEKDFNGSIICDDCLLRRLALLIVSRRVTAREIWTNETASYWQASSLSINKVHHGKQWHSSKMEEIEKHFLGLGYNVERQPHLQAGRADLGIYHEHCPPLYIEIGTTTFFKIWYNLSTISSLIYLIMPDDERLIEFTKKYD